MNFKNLFFAFVAVAFTGMTLASEVASVVIPEIVVSAQAPVVTVSTTGKVLGKVKALPATLKAFGASIAASTKTNATAAKDFVVSAPANAWASIAAHPYITAAVVTTIVVGLVACKMLKDKKTTITIKQQPARK